VYLHIKLGLNSFVSDEVATLTLKLEVVPNILQMSLIVHRCRYVRPKTRDDREKTVYINRT
jgi:hypothetical protein